MCLIIKNMDKWCVCELQSWIKGVSVYYKYGQWVCLCITIMAKECVCDKQAWIKGVSATYKHG